MKMLKAMAAIAVAGLILVTTAGCGQNASNAGTAATTAVTSAVAESSAASDGAAASANAADPEAEPALSPMIDPNVYQLALPAKGEEIAVMHTSLGILKIRFFPEEAPKAVENFITHSKNGYYNGLTFHRVIQDFMIQGGDPLGTGTGGESIWGKDFEDEFSMKVFNLRGALCMANSGADTNGSQFFIVQATSVDPSILSQLAPGGWPQEAVDAYTKYGGTPHLDHKHTVFGQVIAGLEMLDAIAAVKTDDSDKPVEDVKINSIEIVKWEE